MAKQLPKTIAEKYVESLHEKWVGLEDAFAQEGPSSGGSYFACSVGAMMRSGMDMEEIKEKNSDPAHNCELLQPVEACLADYWRLSKHVFRFDETLNEEISKQVLPGSIPVNALSMVPYPLQFVEAPVLAPVSRTQAIMTRGFFVFVTDFPGSPRVFFQFICPDLTALTLPVTLSEETTISTLADSIDSGLLPNLVEHGKASRLVEASAESCLARLFNLVLYINSENADIEKIYSPSGLTRKKKASQSTIYVVGGRVGAALGAARKLYFGQSETIGEPQRTVSPHVRRAHFHTYHKKGPAGEDCLILKWLSPILVNMGEEPSVSVHVALPSRHIPKPAEK